MKRYFILLLLCASVAFNINSRVYQKTVNGVYKYESEESSDNGGKRIITIFGPVDDNGKPNGLWVGKVVDHNLMTSSYTVWNGTLQLTRGYKHGVPNGTYRFSDTRSYRYRKGGGGRRNELYTGTYNNGRPTGQWSISSPMNDNFRATLTYNNGVLVSENMNANDPYPTLEYYMSGGEFTEYHTGLWCDGKHMDERPKFEKSQKELQEIAEWQELNRINDLQRNALESYYDYDRVYSNRYVKSKHDSIYYVAMNFMSEEKGDSVRNYIFAVGALSQLAKADSVFQVYPQGEYYKEYIKYKDRYNNDVNSLRDAYEKFITVNLPKIASKYAWIEGTPNDFAGYAMRNEMTKRNALGKQSEYLREKSQVLLEQPLTKADWEHYARYHGLNLDKQLPVLVRLFLKDLIVIQANNGWIPTLDYEELKSRFVKPTPTFPTVAPYLPIGELNVMGVVESIYRYKNRHPEVHKDYNMIDIKADHYYIGFDRSEKDTTEKWGKYWEKTWEKLKNVYTEDQLFSPIMTNRR